MEGPREMPARLRTAGLVMAAALHVVVILLVLGAILERFGREPAIAAGLLFPITYLVGPLLLGVAAGEWLAFALQLTAIVASVGLVGMPAIDREQRGMGQGCLQVAASTLLVVVIDMALHVAALALVLDRVNRDLGTDAAVLAAALFPVTYVIGPLALAFFGADWLPLAVQVSAFGLIGLLVLLSDA